MNANSIALTASGVEDADYYEWSMNGKVESTTTGTKTYSSLTPNTTYTIKVRARYTDDDVDVYTAWVEKVFTTLATA